ncbi:hypothetical protein [Azospirillum thermophilum]|uniref:Flagellar basal body-associated protein FliL n=1 Tax=Azospirillum thermophilum TaxID=2202148 RepID=A0A2S2CVE3_9PROT|nr:hypothetical protein [Azospirillum thermophilum]AWK88257.1 hypothetical protein DEW08_19355 [Azospirillum thermophilum]
MERRFWRDSALFLASAAVAAGIGYGVGRLDLGTRATPEQAAVTDKPLEGPGPFLVDIGQLMVPVLVDGRTNAFILTQITLEAGSVDQANLIRRHMIHARSALLQGLFGLAGTGFFDGPTVDPAAASRALRQSANEQLGSNIVKGVLIDRLMRQENTRL